MDLTHVTNEKKRKQLESMINSFGQTPTQLFFGPHLPRLSLEEARKSLAGKFSVSGQKLALSIFENLKELKAFSIEVNKVEICGRTCENQPCECKLCQVIFLLISSALNVVFYFCNFQKKAH